MPRQAKWRDVGCGPVKKIDVFHNLKAGSSHEENQDNNLHCFKSVDVSAQ